MPYIPYNERDDIFREFSFNTPGQFNYAISCMIDAYLWEHKPSYTTINEVIGVLECAKLELYRRIAAPYEDKKLEENGDVYTLSNS